jgi:hypothetical protein
MLPLIQRLDKEFHLGLPLVEIERRLTAAQEEPMAINQNRKGV